MHESLHTSVCTRTKLPLSLLPRFHCYHALLPHCTVHSMASMAHQLQDLHCRYILWFIYMHACLHLPLDTRHNLTTEFS